MVLGDSIGPYRVLAKLGEGGMGEVYRAHDSRLNRTVAIKVLRADVATDPDRLRRFEQEARAASALNHPNIITIYDVGQADSAPFIAMEWVAGQSLRDTMSRGRASARTLLQIGRQLAEGLAKAHAEGIVHRDLKPENVMLTDDGLVKILDFGLAKLTSSREAIDEAATVDVTQAGIVLGTIGYMSPEQAAGRPLDHRSDQFSLGLILYELATGKRPFQRETAAQTMAAIIQDQPQDVTSLNPKLPAHLSVIINRCLAKSPSDRYESTRDLARDLKDVLESTPAPSRSGTTTISRSRRQTAALVVASTIAVLTIAGTAVWLLGGRTRGEPVASDDIRRVVAVRAFENLSDPAQAYFAAGMTEEIRGQLAKLSALRLLSRNAVDRLGGVNAKQIGDSLGAGSVVEGTVRLDQGRVRVSVDLIDTRTDHALWSDQYERRLEDVFAVQTDVALQIARALNATLNANERELVAKRPTTNMEAYQIFLRSQELNSVDRQQNTQAIGLLKKALELDPRFAVAQSRLAYRTLFSSYYQGPQHIETARELVLKAIEIDPQLSDAYFVLGSVYGHKGLANDSRRAFQKALELNANGRGAMANLSVLEGEALGRWDEGLHWGRRAFQQSAHEGNDFYHLVHPLLFLRDDATSRRWIEEGVRRSPDSPRLNIVLAALDYLEGKEAAAMNRVREMADKAPGNEEVQMTLCELAFLTGQADAEVRIEPYARRAGDLAAASLIKPESFRTLYASLLGTRRNRQGRRGVRRGAGSGAHAAG